MHQPQMHSPVAMEHFLQGGGTPKSGIPQDEIIRKVLHHGKCIREVDGASHSAGDMNLGNKVCCGCLSFFLFLFFIYVMINYELSYRILKELPMFDALRGRSSLHE